MGVLEKMRLKKLTVSADLTCHKPLRDDSLGDFKAFSKLQVLDLSSNKLALETTIVKIVREATSLKELDLSKNRLS